MRVIACLLALASTLPAQDGRGPFDVANIDNIALDRTGGVWFGTDGNFSTNGTSDAIYYLALDPSHEESYGKAFRIAAVPSDAEASGPSFNGDETTLFFSVQHPGENVACDWPSGGRPLSSVVALVANEPLPDFARRLARGGTPLPNAAHAALRVVKPLRYSIVARWLDPLGKGLFFGANCDYTQFFSDEGDPNRGWLWVNHEYVSNLPARVGAPPTGQFLTLAVHLKERGILTFDVTDGAKWDQAAVDTFVEHHKKHVGGSWIRIRRDGDAWRLEPDAAHVRYDNTSNTLLRLVGPAKLSRPQWDDDGNRLEDGIAVGLNSDCSGGRTPWGTIFTAEENIQYSYGDLEDWWSSKQVFDPSGGAKAGQVIRPTIPASRGSAMGMHSAAGKHHKDRDAYGYLCEIDPGVDPKTPYDVKTGVGHRKLATMGAHGGRTRRSSPTAQASWSTGGP